MRGTQPKSLPRISSITSSELSRYYPLPPGDFKPHELAKAASRSARVGTGIMVVDSDAVNQLGRECPQIIHIPSPALLLPNRLRPASWRAKAVRQWLEKSPLGAAT
jgi:hypothetical protein